MESVSLPEDVVYGQTLQVLSEDQSGELDRLIDYVVKWEKEHPPQTEYDGFEWHQVYGDPRTLGKLVTNRVLQIRFKSNKCIMYRTTNLEGVQRALNDYRGMTAPPIEKEESEIPDDLFQIIVGHNEKKDIIMRSITSLSKKPVHCILHGSVASAKTLFLQELTRLPRNRFVLGSSLTKAGLYEVMFNEQPKYLIIDELDKIDDAENLSALLSLMETGFLSETKWRRHRKRYFTTWVFASANRLSKISEELMSRFEPLRFKDYTRDEFIEVTLRVLTEREHIPATLAPYIAKRTLADLDTKDVRAAIRVARLLKNFAKSEVDHIVDMLKKQK